MIILRVILIATAVLAGIAPSRAAAQERGRVGVSIAAYPGTVGLHWQAGPRLAVRPEFAFESTTSERTSRSSFSTSRSSDDFWQASVGLSLLFHVYQQESLALYVSPRYMHSRGGHKGTSASSQGVPVTRRTESDPIHTVSGSLGARYSLGDRFGVFGEFGVSHDRSSGSSEEGENPFGGVTEGKGTRIGIRSHAGIVLFF